MRKSIYESELISIWYDSEHELLLNEWNQNSVTMSDDEFIHEITHFAQLSEKYQVKGLLGNTKNFGFTISPNLQEWHDSTITPIYTRAGVKKIALIASSDIFALVSIKQTMEENQASMTFMTQYFEEVSDAQQWLISQ